MTSNGGNAPVVKVQMMIRRPVADVFEAFVDPAVTRRFWFSRGSGRLHPGATVRWHWDMYGVSTQVVVGTIATNERILIEWDGPEHPTSVEWTFDSRDKDRTFVTVRNWGFAGDPDGVVKQALDATGGFSFVLAGAKAFLEHGIELKLVLDHDPSALVSGWR